MLETVTAKDAGSHTITVLVALEDYPSVTAEYTLEVKVVVVNDIEEPDDTDPEDPEVPVIKPFPDNGSCIVRWLV